MIPQNAPLVDLHLSREMARRGDVDAAIDLASSAYSAYLRSGDFMWFIAAAALLVELLLQRGFGAD